MSATADSTTPGPHGVPAQNSRFGQPQDAVAMENMPQSTPASPDEPRAGDNAAHATEPSSQDPAAAPVESEKTGDDGVAAADHQAATLSKEKERKAEEGSESAPTPLSKETQDASMAIGPAQDEIKALTPGTPDTSLICNITLLLASGGRHPYKIDSKYLGRRNVTVPEETEDGQPDPFSISVYTLKELILREWRNDWEAQPASPSSIRLIHFGKLLEDKEPLKKYQFSTENPNVVHMSIRPQDLDEEEPKTGGKNPSSGGGDGSRSRGGCCVVL